MLGALRKWLCPPPGLEVDFTVEPKLPNGAKAIRRHTPAGEGKVTISPADIELIEFTPFDTYDNFYQQNHTLLSLADACVIDAFWRVMAKAKSYRDVNPYLGDFSGQIFFLGTEFESHEGIPCVPYLNLRTHVERSGRFLCPSVQIINHNVLCCAAVLNLSPRLAKS